MFAQNRIWLAAAVVVLALLPLWPGVIDSYAFSFLFFVFVYAILAQGWNLIAGFGGQIIAYVPARKLVVVQMVGLKQTPKGIRTSDFLKLLKQITDAAP